jgi:hypothetical protein
MSIKIKRECIGMEISVEEQKKIDKANVKKVTTGTPRAVRYSFMFFILFGN